MRWVTYRALDQTDAVDRIGLVMGEMIHALEGTGSLQDLLGDDGTRLREAAECARQNPVEIRAITDARLLAPIRGRLRSGIFLLLRTITAPDSRHLGSNSMSDGTRRRCSTSAITMLS